MLNRRTFGLNYHQSLAQLSNFIAIQRQGVQIVQRRQGPDRLESVVVCDEGGEDIEALEEGEVLQEIVGEVEVETGGLAVVERAGVEGGETAVGEV